MAQLVLGAPGGGPATRVSLFDQGLTQVLQAAVTGLEPRKPHLLVLASTAQGDGPLEPLAAFVTNPAGAAIVNAVGPIRQFVQGSGVTPKRHWRSSAGRPLLPAHRSRSSSWTRLSATGSGGRRCSTPRSRST